MTECAAVAPRQTMSRGLGPVELTEHEIRERMSGNICRCGAYPGIVTAMKMAEWSSQ